MLGQIGDPLVDGVLMRTGKGGEHQFSRVGMPGIHLHVGAVLVDLFHMVHVGEIQSRVHPLGVQVHG